MKTSRERRTTRGVLRDPVGTHPAVEFVSRLCDTFVELRREKVSLEASEVVGGLASIEGISILAVILCESQVRKRDHLFASVSTSRSGYRKVQHLMQLAHKFRLPIVVFVTSSGALPGVDKTEPYESIDITQHVFSQMHSKSPMILAVLSRSHSGEVFGAWLGQNVLAFKRTRFSMIVMSQGMHCHVHVEASQLYRGGVIDAIISEPPRGVHSRRRAKLKLLKSALSTMLIELSKLSLEELVMRRKDKLQRLSAIVSEVGRREEWPLCDGTLFHASVINGDMPGQA